MANDPKTIYRFTSLGAALKDTLDKFVQGGAIPESLSNSFLMTFQETMSEELATSSTTASLRGKVHTYRNNQGTYTFYVQDAQMDQKRSQMLKIVCVDEQTVRKSQQEKRLSDEPHKKAKNH